MMTAVSKNLFFSATIAVLLIGQPLTVVAQSPTTPGATRSQAVRITGLKSRADQEINRRIAMLNTVISRINSMQKITDSDKNSFTSQAQTQITNLNSLKTKIDADNDLDTLRTDVKSIVNAYRIYMLFIPRLHILAAADRMNDIADEISQITGTLQMRITQAQTSGKDVTNLQTALADLQSKLSDAKAQYQNAETVVTPLTPDEGDASKMDGNKAALQSARTMIKTGAQDLKAARNDIKTIRLGLKDDHPTASTRLNP